MTTRKVVLVALLSGLLGATVGVAGTLWFAMTFTYMGVLPRAEADLVVNTAMLERLQQDNVQVARQLVQSQIDGTLITLDTLAADGASFSPQTYERIESIRRLREASPHQPTEPEVAAAVQRALQLQPPASD